jgi:hypothetical protein
MTEEIILFWACITICPMTFLHVGGSGAGGWLHLCPQAGGGHAPLSPCPGRPLSVGRPPHRRPQCCSLQPGKGGCCRWGAHQASPGKLGEALMQSLGMPFRTIPWKRTNSEQNAAAEYFKKSISKDSLGSWIKTKPMVIFQQPSSSLSCI